MSNTNRKYTQITYEQVVSDLQNILRAKEGPLADLGEASYGKTLLELNAANADLMANWGEASFANSFLETATSPESIYLGARSLGYSVRRPVPAKAGFGISLKRTGVYPTIKVNIPRGTQFSVSGVSVTAMDDVEFSYDRSDPNFENGLMTLTSGRAVLAEGGFRSVDFFSDSTQNQDFIVSDAQFSDYFGFGDPNWSVPDSFSRRPNYFTTVTSDASLLDNFDPANAVNDKVYWRISRRGFQDPTINETINDLDNFTEGENRTLNYTVIINTANDGRAQLKFSDGVKSAIPFGRISVSYFSTLGETGNLFNVAGSTLNTDSTNIIISQADGSESDIILADLNIALTTDVRGGMNIESSDSIKANAPQIYNSLDSLGNRSSYMTFLKRYSDVKYANAFGEDVLTRIYSKDASYSKPNIKYANIVRFSALKDLYRNNNDVYYPTDPFEYYIEGYKVSGLSYLWQYDYQDLPKREYSRTTETDLASIQTAIQTQLDTQAITISTRDPETGELVPVIDASQLLSIYASTLTSGQNIIPDKIFSANLEPLDFAEVGSELELMLRSLNERGYLTLGGGQHMYVPPVVHDYTISTDVILFKGMNFSDIKSKIKSDIYAYLKEYTEFSKPIFRSKIECIIQKYPEVAGVNLNLVAKGNDFENLDLTKLTWLGSDTSQFINQTGLIFDGFNVSLDYDYRYEQINGADATEDNKNVTFNIGSQLNILKAIVEYYKTIIAYRDVNTGQYLPKENLTEEDINRFTGFIWARMINEVYVPIFEQYKTLKANGNMLNANATYNVIEAIKGWYFLDGELAFKETASILNMTEDNSKSLFNYFVYTLEYVKLVRNILNPRVARKLLDSYGNISRYSNENEIVQFNISTDDIKITVESDSYASKERVR